jgi:hypothetical protein
MVVVRKETGPKSLYVGVSGYPYTDWKFTEVSTFAGGPSTIMLPDSSIYMAHRSFRFGSARLCLSKVSTDSVEEDIIIESNGDCGYAGMHWYEGALWMSYYSSDPYFKAKIYLAKIVFDVPQKDVLSTDQ